jgi:ABC-type branched-subunit amino acid transport system substrate-binding protein
LPQSATSAGPEISAAIAANPAVIITALQDPVLVSADQAARSEGYKGAIINFAQGSSYTDLSQLKDPKLYVLRSFSYSAVAKGSGVSALIKDSKAEGVDPLTEQVVNGFTQAIVMGAALEKCGYPCPGPALAKSLQGLGSLNTGGLTFGPFLYNKTSHMGITEIGLYHWNVSKNAAAQVGSVAVQNSNPAAS